MPTRPLTDKFCDRVKPPAAGRVEYFDATVGALALRVTATGHKSWNVFYTMHGRDRRYTIGGYPAFSLKAARKAAGEALQLKEQGIDPGAAKKAQRETRPDTFEAVARDYLARYVEENTAASTYRETTRILERDVIPAWRGRAIASISRADVNALVGRIAKRGAKVQANRTVARLRTLFNWAASQGYVADSPLRGVKLPTKERERERVLTDDEIKWFWQACGALGRDGWPFGPLFKLLLLTAQRRDEVGAVVWSELDLEKRLWTIPRERAKNDRTHDVQLSDPAVEILTALRARRDQNLLLKDSPLIFTTNGKTPVSGFSRAKENLDEEMEKLARKARGLPEEDEPCRAALKLKPGEDIPRLVPEFLLHDLRRTAATGMAGLNIPPHVVDKVLNHVSGTIRGVARVYNRFTYRDERRGALDAWGRRVMALVAPADDNIVELQKRMGSN